MDCEIERSKDLRVSIFSEEKTFKLHGNVMEIKRCKRAIESIESSAESLLALLLRLQL